MKAKNIGSSFDDFLKEEAILDESTAVAVKSVIAWQIDQEMKSQILTKSAMAKNAYQPRSAQPPAGCLRHHPDTNDPIKCSIGAGQKLRIELEAA